MINTNLKKKIFLTTMGIVIIFLNIYLRYIIKEEQLLITWKENISVIGFFFSIFFTLTNVFFFFYLLFSYIITIKKKYLFFLVNL